MSGTFCSTCKGLGGYPRCSECHNEIQQPESNALDSKLAQLASDIHAAEVGLGVSHDVLSMPDRLDALGREMGVRAGNEKPLVAMNTPNITTLWNAMPRDVQRKISLHDLKRIVEGLKAGAAGVPAAGETPETDALATNLLDSPVNIETACEYLMDHSRKMERERNEALVQLAATKREAETLATSIWRTEYQPTAPEWKLLPDVAGVISQIDNMYAGVRDQRDAEKARLDWLEIRWQDFEGICCRGSGTVREIIDEQMKQDALLGITLQDIAEAGPPKFPEP